MKVSDPMQVQTISVPLASLVPGDTWVDASKTVWQIYDAVNGGFGGLGLSLPAGSKLCIKLDGSANPCAMAKYLTDGNVDKVNYHGTPAV